MNSHLAMNEEGRHILHKQEALSRIFEQWARSMKDLPFDRIRSRDYSETRGDVVHFDIEGQSVSQESLLFGDLEYCSERDDHIIGLLE
jgi:hypothetical protein